MAKKRIARVFMQEDPRFNPTKPLDFYTNDETLKVGDAVVVETRCGIFFAEVIDFPLQSERANKWVICKVDLAAHHAMVEREERKTAIKEQLEEKLKATYLNNKFRELAAIDEEAAKLVSELEALENGEV